MAINFTISRKELLEVLIILEPYIILLSRKKEDDMDADEKLQSFSIPEVYFGDKVRFDFCDTSTMLSVFVNDVHVEVSCNITESVKAFSFCVSLPYLKNVLIRCHSEYIRFEEEAFFGFIAYDADVRYGKIKLFEVEAFSVRNQKSFYPKFFDTLYPFNFRFEKQLFVNALVELYKYCAQYTLRPALKSVWYYITEGICRVVASNGHIMSMRKFPTQASGEHCICILSDYALRIIDTLKSWSGDILSFSYSDKYVRLFNYEKVNQLGFSIDVPISGERINYKSIL